MNDDFIDLYGVDAAQGMQVHPRRFWSCFSGPVGAEADAHRARLLDSYLSIPDIGRRRFLSRLHSEEMALAVGAWAELEFVHFAMRSGVRVVWTDEQQNSVQGRRSIDLVVVGHGARLNAEVTHCREEPPPPHAAQMFSFFGGERVPVGVYALTAGEGQPPISRLRTALRLGLSAGASTLLDVRVEGWSIRQLSGQAPLRADMRAETTRYAKFAKLADRVGRALKKKRRQARDADLKDVLLSIVILDRESEGFLQFVAEQPEILAPIIYGSADPSGLVVRAVALGAVPSDRFPPTPTWALVTRHQGSTFDTTGFDVPTIQVPRLNHPRNDRACGGENEEEFVDDRLVFYATVTQVSPK